MKPVFCKPLPYAKSWRVASAHPAKAWHLNYSRRDSIVAEEVSAPRSYYQEDDPYSRESLADISTNGRSSTRRRRRRTSPDSSPPASRYNGSETSAYSSSTANGSSSSYHSGSAYGSSSGYGSGSAYDSPSAYDSGSAYGSNSSTGDSSTDRSQLLNWSHNRSRSRSASVDRSTRRRSPSPSPERRASSYSAPLTQTVSESIGGAEVGRATEPHSEASPHQSERRGRTLRRRQERHRSPAAPEPKPASSAAVSSSGATTSPRVSSRSARAPPSSNAADYGSYCSPGRARSRSRSPSPIPEELAEIKTWLSKDSSPSPAARAAVGSSRVSPAPQAIPANSGAAVTESAAGRPASTHSSHSSRRLPAFGSPSAGSMQPAISSTAPSSTPPLPSSPSKLAISSRHRSHSRSPSPRRHSSPDPELEKMKTWLKTHEDDDPLAVKPFELVARGHSPARVSSPERTPAWAGPRSSLAKPTPRVGTPASAASSAEFSTPTTAADSARLSAATPAACVSAPTKQVATKNGVIDLSNLPASQKHHVREVDVEDLPQTHADYGRALKEMTEVMSVMGWAKAKLEDEHHSVAEVPVLPLVPVSTPVASTSKPESNKKPVGGMSDPALQATTFTCLAAAAAVVSAVALLSPGVMLQVCFSGTPTALEATLARVIGSGVMISAVTNLCLKDAAVHDRLGSATYQRLMGAKVWESVTAGAVLAFHAALCTPMLLALLVPLLGAGAASNCAILSATSGSPLPPRISLSTPANSTALGYTLLSASLLLSAAACLLPLGLIHGSVTLHLPLLHHLAASGLLATAIVACVLQDAANRDRLGASTFKTLNLGMAACLGALALSLGAGLKQLLVVPTLVTLPVMALTGAGAVFCLIMFSFSKKPKKA